MELQLGLALPNIHIHDQIKHGNIIGTGGVDNCFQGRNNYFTKRKRSFEDHIHANIAVFDHQNDPSQIQTLPLLSWNDQPRDGDDPAELKKTHFCVIAKKEEEKDQVVGWPPIKLWRRKEFHRRQRDAPVTENRRSRVAVTENNGNGGRLFVKVKMEGVGIARKLDLRLYHSYQSLKTALITMFSAYKIWEKDDWDLTLIYEDKEGDWLLAEDLPWNTFVESVQRLKILVQKRDRD